MKKKALLAETLVFLLFLGLFFVWNLALPDRAFSEQENRMLQTAPKFTFSGLFSGKFTASFEAYLSDQFALRDDWTALKARAELACGKAENNGVFLCADETLIEPYTAPAQADLDFSLSAVKTLGARAGVPVFFALIPSPCEILADALPAGAPNDSQRETIDYAYARAGVPTVDVRSKLAAHADEPIFYRTDHHWTTLGAYYGYTALAEAMGFDPVPLRDYTETVVTDDFCGTAYSASGFRWVAPDTISRYVEPGGERITNYPEGEPVPGTLYDESALEGKDKYKYFYGGNTPLLTIETGLAGAPSLLILRDSYMDALSPFLLAHFSEIHILDLRYYRSGVHDYLTSHGIDEVLVCYNVKNFVTDGNLFLLGG
jgi:hypothetical protein